MDVVELAGRILFAVLFLINGWAHVTDRETMVGVGRAIGAPRPHLTVPLTGVVMLVSGVLIAIGFWADLGALMLAVFLPIAGFLAHAYWKETDPMMAAAQKAQFWKNIALAGAALMLLAFFARYGDQSDLSVGTSLF